MGFDGARFPQPARRAGGGAAPRSRAWLRCAPQPQNSVRLRGSSLRAAHDRRRLFRGESSVHVHVSGSTAPPHHRSMRITSTPTRAPLPDLLRLGLARHLRASQPENFEEVGRSRTTASGTLVLLRRPCRVPMPALHSRTVHVRQGGEVCGLAGAVRAARHAPRATRHAPRATHCSPPHRKHPPPSLSPSPLPPFNTHTRSTPPHTPRYGADSSSIRLTSYGSLVTSAAGWEMGWGNGRQRDAIAEAEGGESGSECARCEVGLVGGSGPRTRARGHCHHAYTF